MYLNYLFICLNVIFVLKGLFYFFPRKCYFYFIGVRDRSDLDTRLPEIWRVLLDVFYSRATNLAVFRLYSSTPVWFNILK